MDLSVTQEIERNMENAIDKYGEDSAQASWWSNPENVTKAKHDILNRRFKRDWAYSIFGAEGEEGDKFRQDLANVKGVGESWATFLGDDGKLNFSDIVNTADAWRRLGEDDKAIPKLETSGFPNNLRNLIASTYMGDATAMAALDNFDKTGSIDTLGTLINMTQGAPKEKIDNLLSLAEKYTATEKFIQNPIEGTREAVEGFVQGAGNLLRSDRGNRNDLYASAGGALQPSLGQITADDLYEKGQNASRAVSNLAALWEGQEQRDVEYQAELDRIREGQSHYTQELERIGTDKDTYSGELTKLSEQKKLYEDEVSRIQKDQAAWDTQYSSATEHRDKLAAEIERLEPWDQEFRNELRFGLNRYGSGGGSQIGFDRPDRYGVRRSGDSWDREGNFTAGNISGREFLAQNDKWYRGTRTQYTTSIVEKYKKYLDDMDALRGQQTEHSEYITGLESSRDDLSSYLTATQTNLGSLTDYFGQIQEQSNQLNIYGEQVQEQSDAFNQYEVDYRRRRQENMDYRRSATINYQQQISDFQNQGVEGIRTNREFYNQFTPNRRESPRGTFNRDSWRIQNLNV